MDALRPLLHVTQSVGTIKPYCQGAGSPNNCPCTPYTPISRITRNSPSVSTRSAISGKIDAVGGALDRFDEQALVAFLVDGTDVTAVDFQVGQAQARQVADHAEATAKTLQAQGEAQLAQTLGQVFQHGLIG